MARYTIYHSDGTAVYTGVCRYSGSYLKVPYVEFDEIASPVAIDWRVGDYLDYGRTGLRYVLSYIPQPERRAKDNKSGESFVYKNVQLHDATKDLERVPFWNYVLNDNNIFYSSRPETSTYEDVYGIANRIQQCLTQARTDGIISNTWEVHVLGDEDYPLDPQDTEEAKMLALLSEPREFSINDGSILECLNAVYDTWDLVGWLHLVDGGTDILLIGKPLSSVNGVTRVFQYGKGLGLSLVAKSHTNLSEMATRLYVFGSSKNMLPGYHRNDPTILNSESNDIERLMIPKQYWGKTGNLFDPHKAYIDAKQGIVPPLVDGSYPIAKYGIIVRRVDFDGGDNGEIYPTISGITAGIERAAYDALSDTTGYYRANPSIYPDAERLDELKNGGDWTGDDGVPVSQSVSGDVNETITPTVSTTTNYTFRQYIFLESRLSVEGSVDIAFTPSITVTVTTNGFTWARRNITLTLKDDWGRLYRTQTAVQDSQNGGNLTFSFRQDTFSGTTGLIYGLLEGTLVCSREITPSDVVTVTATGSYSFLAYKNYREPFTVTLKQIGFDISKFAGGASNIGRLVMKDGGCGGRSFAITACEYNSATDDWTVTCQRSFDKSLNQYFPNETSPLATGDHFVLSDIIMPGMYVSMAEQRLYQMALELLKELCVPKFLYEPEIDAKVVLRTAYDQYGVCQLKEGKFFRLYDESLKIVENASHTDYLVIDTLEIREGESNIPTYKVTLRERKTVKYSAGSSSSEDTSVDVQENTAAGDIGALGDLSDVTLTGLLDGQIIRYDSTAGQWVNRPFEDSYFEKVNIGSAASPVYAVRLKPTLTDGTTITGLYSEGFVSAGGLSTTGGGGGGAVTIIDNGDYSYTISNGTAVSAEDIVTKDYVTHALEGYAPAGAGSAPAALYQVSKNVIRITNTCGERIVWFVLLPTSKRSAADETNHNNWSVWGKKHWGRRHKNRGYIRAGLAREVDAAFLWNNMFIGSNPNLRYGNAHMWWQDGIGKYKMLWCFMKESVMLEYVANNPSLHPNAGHFYVAGTLDEWTNLAQQVIPVYIHRTTTSEDWKLSL